MEIKLSEFVTMVTEMRHYQKLFFTSKSRQARAEHLAKSKLLEKKVDNWITNYNFFK